MPRPSARPILAVLSVALLLAVSNGSAEDWPQWRGPDRDGISEESIRDDLKANPPTLIAMMDGMGQGYASLAIVDGDAYTTGNFPDGQKVIGIALDSPNSDAVGELLFATPLTDGPPKHGYDGSRCTPTVDGARLYVTGSDGQIACLDRIKGDILWQRDFADFGGKMMSGWGFSESPLVDGENVLCTPGGPDALVVCLNKTTGREVWRSAPEFAAEGGEEFQGKDGAGYASLVISNAAGVKQYVGLSGRGAFGIRARDGEPLWTYNRVANPTANIPTPVTWDEADSVFVSSGYNDGGAALLKLTARGETVSAEEAYWKPRQEFQNHHGGMIRVGQYLYAGHRHNEGFPTCLDLETGEIVWGGSRNRGPGQGSAAITLVGDQLLFRYQDGRVAFIEATPEAYRLTYDFMPDYQEGKSWAHPVVFDGVLYLREQNKLMAYDVR